MKIEKLTDDKIRVIVKLSDLDIENIDVYSLMTKPSKGQNFFSKMLEKAKKEVGFNTDGCKLLIEAFSSADGILIFTITKFSSKENTSCTESTKKKLTVKKRSVNFSKKQAIYEFKNFDEFCDFCKCIHHLSNFDIKQFSKNISLYLYHDTYYLIAENINTSYEHMKSFYLIASEFSKHVAFSSSFKNKLLEHGKAIIKKNAITIGIKYFVSE